MFLDITDLPIMEDTLHQARLTNTPPLHTQGINIFKNYLNNLFSMNVHFLNLIFVVQLIVDLRKLANFALLRWKFFKN